MRSVEQAGLSCAVVPVEPPPRHTPTRRHHYLPHTIHLSTFGTLATLTEDQLLRLANLQLLCQFRPILVALNSPFLLDP